MSLEQVPVGYKQTDIGIFPEDWVVKEVSSIGKVIRGASPRPKGDPRFYGGTVPRLMVEDITRDKHWIVPQVDYLTEAGSKLSRLCSKGTLILVCSGTPSAVGLPGILDTDACIHDGILGLVNINKEVSNEYLFFRFLYMQRKLFDSATHGGTFVNLTTDSFREFKIPLPPTKAEQKHIANALTDVDTLITSLEKLIAKKRAIKTAVMQQLLTGKKRVPPFDQTQTGCKQAELGDIPEGWEVKQFSSAIREVIDNRGKTPPLVIDGLPMLEVNAVYKQGKNPNLEKVSKYVSESTYNSWFRDGHPEEGNILVVTVGSAGETSFVNSPGFCIAQNLIALKISSSFNPEYIFYITKTRLFKRQVEAVLMGAVQPSLKVPHLMKFDFLCPKDKKEQEAIANVLSDMDCEIDSLEQQLTKTQQLKQGMMQELLTGRTRLV